MKHRSETERIALILEAINCNNNRRGESQTRIMYKAYLSHSQLKEYLSVLLEKGLIEYHKEDRLYTITDKGMHFLDVYNRFNQLHTSNVFNTTTEFQIIEPTQVSAEHKSGYLALYNNKQIAQAYHHRLKVECEKCPAMFANHKELKLHKIEYYSY